MTQYCSQEYFDDKKAKAIFAKENNWIDSKGYPIDPDMIPLVDFFIDKEGITTAFCCEGHDMDNKVHFTYIVFCIKEYDMLRRLTEAGNAITSAVQNYNELDLHFYFELKYLYADSSMSVKEHVVHLSFYFSSEEHRVAGIDLLRTHLYNQFTDEV